MAINDFQEPIKRKLLAESPQIVSLQNKVVVLENKVALLERTIRRLKEQSTTVKQEETNLLAESLDSKLAGVIDAFYHSTPRKKYESGNL